MIKRKRKENNRKIKMSRGASLGSAVKKRRRDAGHAHARHGTEAEGRSTLDSRPTVPFFASFSRFLLFCFCVFFRFFYRHRRS